MRAYIITIVALLCVSTVFSQGKYLDTQFLQDKKVLKKAVYQRLKENGMNSSKKEDSLRVIIIYRFQEFDLDTVEIHDNNYLSKINPCYQHSDYLLFPIFRSKFPLKKRLSAKGYVINEGDELVATITSTTGFPFKIIPFSFSNSCDNEVLIQRDNEYRSLTNNVLLQNYDLLFYLGLTGSNIIWCVKDNETWIYNTELQQFHTLKEHYNCCWEYNSVEDVLGLPR